MRFGIHMPLKGGFEKNVRRCLEIGCNTLQIFAGNPTAWQAAKLNELELVGRKKLLEEHNIAPLIIHAAYLINLASFNEEFYQKSLALFRETMKRAALYGSPYVVLHPGNHGGKGREKGLERLVATIAEQISSWPRGVCLLLENTAGAGTALGADFKDIGKVLSAFPEEVPLGVCFDTAHAWAAGYDLSGEEGVARTLESFEKEIGLNRLKVIHTNDNPYDLGSQKDRHTHIGEGKIGLSGFKALLEYPWPKDLPLILETPEIGTDYDLQNLQRLKKCAAGGPNESE